MNRLSSYYIYITIYKRINTYEDKKQVYVGVLVYVSGVATSGTTAQPAGAMNTKSYNLLTTPNFILQYCALSVLYCIAPLRITGYGAG